MLQELTIETAYRAWQEEQLDAHLATESRIQQALSLIYAAKALLLDAPCETDAIVDAISAAIDTIVGDEPNL